MRGSWLVKPLPCSFLYLGLEGHEQLKFAQKPKMQRKSWNLQVPPESQGSSSDLLPHWGAAGTLTVCSEWCKVWLSVFWCRAAGWQRRGVQTADSLAFGLDFSADGICWDFGTAAICCYNLTQTKQRQWIPILASSAYKTQRILSSANPEAHCDAWTHVQHVAIWQQADCKNVMAHFQTVVIKTGL